MALEIDAAQAIACLKTRLIGQATDTDIALHDQPIGRCGGIARVRQIAAIRDAVQNHLLQIVSNLAMEPPPRSGDLETVRDEKVKVLKGIGYADNTVANSLRVVRSATANGPLP